MNVFFCTVGTEHHLADMLSTMMKLWALAVKSTNSPLPIGKWVFWQPCNTTLSFFNSNPCPFWIAAPISVPHCEPSGRLCRAEAQLSCWGSWLPVGQHQAVCLAHPAEVPGSELLPYLSNSRKPESTSSTTIVLIGVKGCKTWTGIVVFAGGTKLCLSIKLGKRIKIAGK